MSSTAEVWTRDSEFKVKHSTTAPEVLLLGSAISCTICMYAHYCSNMRKRNSFLSGTWTQDLKITSLTLYHRATQASLKSKPFHILFIHIPHPMMIKNSTPRWITMKFLIWPPWWRCSKIFEKKNWCHPRWDLNPGPLDYQSSVLPLDHRSLTMCEGF